MAELTQGIDAALSAKSRDEWGPLFDQAGLIWGPVLGLHEVPSDPQAAAIGLFPTLVDETIGEYRSVNIPMRFGHCEVGPTRPAPKLGENTEALKSEFNLPGAEAASD
jgi:crotonobetainyl-CoA:carnitine CoA-transferase CaiB-like acyl-CoA transferase